MSRRATLALVATCLIAVAARGADQAFPAPAPPADPGALGVGVQRTMTLLATSTPAKRNAVRILFYGQSITEQDWSKQVEADLRARFPHADLEVANRAIGGFASQRLVWPAEHDLYPFYPDLLIFHVYGGNKEYEDIIRATRSRTTAEVLMQKDHVTKWPPAVIDQKQDGSAWWDDLMNHHILPDIAKKYGCVLVDVRNPWLDYLKANKLEPKALLKDDVHLNDHGNFLMAKLVGRHLVHRPDLPDSAWRDLVRSVAVGTDATWKGGTLTLRFTGNRIDAIAGAKALGSGGKGRIRIDGKAPSALPELYRFTRPSPAPWSPLALTRVDRQAPLQAEDWTLTITSVAADSASWTYDVAGSLTGPDGSGTSAEPFVSKSGRVAIDPAAFFRNGNVPKGHRITWKAIPMHVDTWLAPLADDPAPVLTTTLAQGLANTEHTLEITSEDGKPLAIETLRVFQPPVR